MASKVSIGLVGCGIGGVALLRELLYLEAEVIVVDPQEGHRLEAIKLGAAEALATLSELPTVNGIIVSALVENHQESVKDAVARNVPVLTESPASSDPKEAARLAKLAPDQLYVMQTLRYHVGIEELTRIAKSEELGEVEWLRITRTSWLAELPNRDATWTLLSQDLSIILEILGDIPQPQHAVAETRNDEVTGVLAILGYTPRIVIEDSTRYSDNRREVRLHCTKGIAVLPDTSSGYIEITRNEDSSSPGVPEPERRSYAPEPPLLRELSTYLEYLRNKRRDPPRSSAEDGLAIAEAVGKLRSLAGS